jgi:hypothetical protein
MNKIQTLSFSINNWTHLYSLQQAIAHNEQLTGRSLSIRGRILNQAFLQNRDTPISIDFIQSDTPPTYPQIDTGTFTLGEIMLTNDQLQTRINVGRDVFEEMRKNLMEYADIEGIHIMVSLGLVSDANYWPETEALQIVKLDYAMKGDA